MPTEMSVEETKDKLFWENWEKSRKNKEEEAKKVAYYRDQFTSTKRASEDTKKIVKASFDGYIAIEGRQWDTESLDILAERGQPANTFNNIKINLDKVLGQIILNPNSTNYSAINQDDISKNNVVDSLYEADNSRSKWRKEKTRAIKDTLIHTGVIEMYTDYSYNTLGNVSIRALNRYTDIDFDAFWTSDDIADCRFAFKSSWLTAREIKDTYHKKDEEIEHAINAYETMQGMSDFIESDTDLACRDREFYDSTRDRFRIIECIYMKQVPKKGKYITEYERYLEENENPDVLRSQGQTIIDLEEYVNVCKILTIAPGISNGIELQNGDHPVQIGRLPFFVASSDLTMGVRQGIATGMLDAQAVLNKRHSMLTAGQTSAANGGLIYKEDLFKNSAVEDDFDANRTAPGKTYKANSNADLTKSIIAVPTGNMPDGLQESIDKMEEFLEKYTNSTAAVSGKSEGANESSILFEAKKAQSQVAHVSLIETLAQLDQELAEAYFIHHKKVYSGPYRRVVNPNTGDVTELNKRVQMKDLNKDELPVNTTVNEYLANGETVAVINEISKLPLHSVIIKRSELGLDQKQRSLSMSNEMMQRSGNPIMKSLYEKSMVPLIEAPEQNLPDMLAAADIYVEFQVEQIRSNIMAMKLQTANAGLQLKQIEQQANAPQQPGVPGAVPQAANIGDSRTAANLPGMGSLPEAIADDQTGANNQSPSDG